jgi:peptidoglycan/LPS O-acetylase OafA/YrhL
MTTAPTALDQARAAERGHALDALRALVVVGLVFFHSALVFDTRDDYYVKNPQTADLTLVAGLGVVWAMPLLLCVAGTAAWHSIRRRGVAGFARERLRRLLVPLVFATLTIIPVPQWLRLRAGDPNYHESYPRFLIRFFRVHLDAGEFPFVVRGRYFETGHLWFVVLLLAFSFLLLPLFAWLLTGHGRRIVARAWSTADRRGVILLGGVPTALITAVLGMEEGIAGWSRWAYLLFFLYGFLIASDERVRVAVRRDAAGAAVLGVTLFAVSAALFLAAAGSGEDPLTGDGTGAVAGRALYGAAGWCWLVAIIGLLDRRRRPHRMSEAGEDGRNRSRMRRSYAYLREAVLPLYILHQPIVVAVAYQVVRWDAPLPVKYAVLATASLVLTVGVYDLLVRRTPITRFLFGMRRLG